MSPNGKKTNSGIIFSPFVRGRTHGLAAIRDEAAKKVLNTPEYLEGARQQTIILSQIGKLRSENTLKHLKKILVLFLLPPALLAWASISLTLGGRSTWVYLLRLRHFIRKRARWTR